MRVLTLGRDNSNDVHVPFTDDQFVTRNCHCQLIKEDDGSYTVVDFSANGTFVNSNKIPKGVPVKLDEYDVLQIGSGDPLPWQSYFKQKSEALKETMIGKKIENDNETKGETKDVINEGMHTDPPNSSSTTQPPKNNNKVLQIILGIVLFTFSALWLYLSQGSTLALITIVAIIVLLMIISLFSRKQNNK